MEPDAIRICSGSGVPQGVKSSTVQLTVRSPTNMLLDVSRDAHSQNYVVTGRLMLAGGGLGQQAIKLKVNDTEYNLSTNGTGFFSKSLDLQPNNNQATSYTISASFSGDSDVKNVTAWSYTLNGYKPSANSTTLTIDPRATGMMTAKSPEEMQKEAENRI